MTVVDQLLIIVSIVKNKTVPFKNDMLKKAVLREQAKIDAKKLGVPLELLTARDDTEEDANELVARAKATQRQNTLTGEEEEEDEQQERNSRKSQHHQQQQQQQRSISAQDEAERQSSCVIC